MANRTGKGGFKPGQSGNPSGRAPLPEEVKKARQFNKIEAAKILTDLIHCPMEELRKIFANPDTPAMKLMITRVIIKAIEEGDYARINFLFDRTIGKVTDDFQVTYLSRILHKRDGTAIEYTNRPVGLEKKEEE